MPYFDLSTAWPWLLIAGLCIAIVLLAMVLASVRSQRSQTVQLLRILQQQQNAGIDGIRDDLAAQSSMQRDELLSGIQRSNDSVLTMLSGVMQLQSDQVNTLIKQSQDTTAVFDHRQQDMQRITEDSLRRMELQMQNTDAQAAALLTQNDARIETLRQAVETGLTQLRTENAQKLEEMRRTVDEKLNDTLEKRLSGSFEQVSQRLEQVYRSLGEMNTLASGVGDLKRMLGNVKTRGVWGEMQLGALLEQALTGSQYCCNVEVVPGSGERVEYAVCLPGKDGQGRLYLPIDSKFPQEDYARLTEAADLGDGAAAEAARKALMNAVKTEAKRIGKYIAPPHTTDFAVMFLPLEGLYAEVMRNTDVVETLQRQQRILVAGPSTLLALLNSLQMGFRTLAIEQRSAEVWELLGTVKSEFGVFAQLLMKTQEKLQQATDSIDTAFVRTRKIEKQLKNVEALKSEASPSLPAGTDS
ncbi:MAG: DNA recombination protein RmuC [Clostridiales bacterium]|nr:DNA recombination protein RmuC [Clostridiales bacterium]